nr:MAG TPA: hypothetical protein [Caudoviricetes sp.]
MEIVTLEYTIKYGDKKECVVLYFKDKESAEKYKKENLEDDPNITLEEDAIGISYYYHDDWYNEINEMAVDKAWSRLNPPVTPGAERVVERVVEKVVEPSFYRVRYYDHINAYTCKILRSEDELKDYMVKALKITAKPIEVTYMSLDRIIEAIENA